MRHALLLHNNTRVTALLLWGCCLAVATGRAFLCSLSLSIRTFERPSPVLSSLHSVYACSLLLVAMSQNSLVTSFSSSTYPGINGADVSSRRHRHQSVLGGRNQRPQTQHQQQQQQLLLPRHRESAWVRSEEEHGDDRSHGYGGGQTHQSRETQHHHDKNTTSSDGAGANFLTNRINGDTNTSNTNSHTNTSTANIVHYWDPDDSPGKFVLGVESPPPIKRHERHHIHDTTSLYRNPINKINPLKRKTSSNSLPRDEASADGRNLRHETSSQKSVRRAAEWLLRPVQKRLQQTRQSLRFRRNQQTYGLDVQQQQQQQLQLLQKENGRLREALRRTLAANERLRRDFDHRIVLETFEGEGKMYNAFVPQATRRYSSDETISVDGSYNLTTEELLSVEQKLDYLESALEPNACPIEPTVSFGEALRDRAYWLVGLLAMQSCSGFILSHNEALLADHPIIIYYLTMLVGAGGNAGNQASVRVIRGLALGTLNRNTQRQFLTRELKMATALSAILSLAGFLRAVLFRTPLPETMAITTALTVIVFSSICLGAVLPLLLKQLGIDPAHSSTTIQVVMDILGVLLTVLVSSLLLDSPLGQMLVGKLSFAI